MPGSQANVSATREARLVQLHRKAQFVGTAFIVPATLLIYFASAVAHPCWQTYGLAAGALAMALTWFVGFRMANRGRIQAAVKVISAAGIGFGTLVLLVREGSNVSMVVVFLALTAYVALFSSRSLLVVSAVAMSSIIGTEVVGDLGLIEKFTIRGAGGTAVKVVFVVIFYPIATYFLRQAQVINEELLERVNQTNLAQGRIIETVGKVQPQLETVVGQINEVATGFASQASQQAVTSRQVNESTESLASMVAGTAEAAADARLIADQTRRDSLTSSRKLEALETGFQEAIGFAENVRDDIGELSSEIERTEEINQAMREIAERLKMLAVNAGLEAAKAGEGGKGFAVIAHELRRMISNTSEDLARSRKLLEEIRGKATVISDRAAMSTGGLRRSFDELRETAGLIASIAESFGLASQRVDTITEAAQIQQQRIGEVSQAMHALDEAASLMTPAASSLAEGVRKLVGAHGELREILGGGSAAAAAATG